MATQILERFANGTERVRICRNGVVIFKVRQSLHSIHAKENKEASKKAASEPKRKLIKTRFKGSRIAKQPLACIAKRNAELIEANTPIKPSLDDNYIVPIFRRYGTKQDDKLELPIGTKERGQIACETRKK